LNRKMFRGIKTGRMADRGRRHRLLMEKNGDVVPAVSDGDKEKHGFLL